MWPKSRIITNYIGVQIATGWITDASKVITPPGSCGTSGGQLITEISWLDTNAVQSPVSLKLFHHDQKIIQNEHTKLARWLTLSIWKKYGKYIVEFWVRCPSIHDNYNMMIGHQSCIRWIYIKMADFKITLGWAIPWFSSLTEISLQQLSMAHPMHPFSHPLLACHPTNAKNYDCSISIRLTDNKTGLRNV